MKRHNLVNRQIQYTLPNISRSKDNQAKRGTQNVVEKLFPDPFRKGKTWAYLWINSPKFYTDCFYFMTSWGLSKQVEIKLQTTCFYLIYSLNKKQKKKFLLDFWRKIFLLLHSINWPNFIVWLLLLCEKLDNMYIVMIY